MKLDNYIDQLVKEMELEGGLTTEVPGVFAFPIEENLTINITDRPPDFPFHVLFVPFTKTQQEEF